VGHAVAFLRDKPGFLLRCHERFGETVRLSLGGPTMLITAPQDVRHVLVTAAAHYTKSPRLVGTAARERLGIGLFTATDADHAQLRSQTSRCFHAHRLAARQPLLDRHSVGFASIAVARGSVDAATHLAPFVAACVVDLLLGADESSRSSGWGDAFEQRRLADETALGLFPSSRVLSWPRRQPLSRLVGAAIAEPSDPDAILRGLFDAPHQPDARAIGSGIEQILLAAYETTTMMLAWAVDLLARHPRWQEPCADEEVAERVISEAMRLFPPTWLFLRVAVEDDLLPSGADVPAGCKIYLSPYVSQRSAAAFANPEAFDPDRFLPDRTIDPWCYYPFGAGGRSCVGERLARRIGVTVLANLMRRGRISPTTRRPPRPMGRITLRPAGGIRVAVYAIE
jgi:cytochrome P450